MVDRFNLPALVFTKDTTSTENRVKGSGRSVKGLNLLRVLEGASSHIIQFGGHAMAAGLTLRTEGIDIFKEKFSNCIGAERDKGSLELHNSQIVDKILNDNTNFEELAYSLKRMEPFGQGNLEPVFMLKNIQMHNVTLLREHLKFSIQMNGTSFHGIGFFMAEQFEVASEPVDFTFKLKQTSFRGRERVEVHAVTIASTV